MTRTGVLVEVLDRLRQVAFALGNHAERAVSEAAATGYVLEADDGIPASDYTYEGRRLLADVAAGIEKAPLCQDHVRQLKFRGSQQRA